MKAQADSEEVSLDALSDGELLERFRSAREVPT
jgi:hypothetical protein